MEALTCKLKNINFNLNFSAKRRSMDCVLMYTQRTMKCNRRHNHAMFHGLTSQVEEGRVVLKRCKRKRQIGLSCVGVLQRVPKDITGTEK
jgi:hypothetical protein